MNDLDEMARSIHMTALDKGFWPIYEVHVPKSILQQVKTDRIMAKLTLIHSEVSELMESIRKSKGPDSVEDECADIVIRLLDLYFHLQEEELAIRNISHAVEWKMEKNIGRAPLHGNAWG